MISSELLSEFHFDGDCKKTIFIQNKTKQMDSIQPLKRMKTMNTDMNIHTSLAEEFFFQTHPFSDLILIVQGMFYIFSYEVNTKFQFILDKDLYVDKSVLAAGSKVFQSYFQDGTIDSIEVLDVSPHEMIELLQFLYPQFGCTISNDNITILLILGRKYIK